MRRVRPAIYISVGPGQHCSITLFAKHHGGKFIVRIEDTDTERNIEAGELSQLENLKWLGIHHDESVDIGGEYGPYRQMERLDLYTKYAQDMLDGGHAYKCFCTPEELEAEREKRRLPALLHQCMQVLAAI